MRKLIAPLLIFCSSFLFAQKGTVEPQNSLLWEITGKPGHKTGYLFGTIHLKDSRVFNFYDSLIPKISACEQFAIEIDPELLVRGTFEMEMREDSVIDLREGAETKEEKDLEDKLEDALGFSLRRMDKKQLRALKRYFGGQKDKADDKPTFLDAWLCDFARRTGKKIRGLETVEGHMEGYETIKSGGIGSLDWESILSGKSKSLLEEMVSNYLSSDHNKIERMYAQSAGEEEMASLVKRNKAMAHAIDSLLKEGTLFSAVGSAHLAGREGVINLLKKLGYTLKPVSTVRTGYYKKLKHEYLDDSWKRESFPEFGYSCVFPARPFRIEKNNSLMYSWTDIGSGINYFSMANFLPENTGSFLAEFTLKLVVEELKKSEDVKIRSSEVKTIEDFTEATVEMEAGESTVSKMRYIIRENVLYTLFAEYHRNNEHPDDVDRFLKSFRFIEKKEAEWKSFVSKAGAFEIFLPQEPREKLIKSTSNGKDFESHFYTSLDVRTGGTYLLRWFDLPAGTAYSSDSLLLKDYSDEFVDAQGKSAYSREESMNRFLGYPSYDVYVVYDDLTAIKVRTVLRGNRVYTLMFSATKEKIEKLQAGAFFNSFELKSFLPARTKKFTHPADTGFSFVAPTPPVFVKGDSIPKEFVRSTYASIDPASGVSYYFSIKDLAPFYYAKDDDAFYHDADELFVKSVDSVLSAKFVLAGEVKMRELVLEQEGVSLLKKVRYFNSGNRIFAVIMLVSAQEKEYALADAVFRSLAYEGPEKKFDFRRKKTTELLGSLSSADTAVARQAKEFCADYNFEKSDLPELYAALKKEYADDGDAAGIKGRLFDALKKFDEPEVSAFYTGMLPLLGNEALGRKAWNDMLRLKNAANKEAVLKLMKEGKLDLSLAAEGFDSLLADPQQALVYFPEILSVADKLHNWNTVYDMAADLATDGWLKEKDMKEAVPRIFENLLFSAVNADDHEAPVKFINWLARNDGGNVQLREYIARLQETKNPAGKLQGVLLALENNVDLDKKALEEIAAVRNQRIALYTELEKRNKENLFPKKYFAQQYFSEADLWEFLGRYDRKIDKVEFYKEMVYEYRGYKQKMFVYKLTYTKNYEQKTAVAFAGPYPVKSDAPIIRGDYTGTSLQDFYPDMLDVLIRQHIKKMKGE